MKTKHDKFIKRTFQLALKAKGYVSPNPLVGAVIVEDGKVISESYHRHFGENHAERNAILQLPENYDFSKSTIYVNLEPCTHFGKTPPCCDLIIKKKFNKVVFAMKDPNSLVSGSSIDKFLNSDIRVENGILENEARYLNRFFIKHINSKVPYITLKVAQSINGKISSYLNNSKWLSNEKSLKNVHKLRSEYDAILVGTKTIINDIPKLDVRLINGRNPKRILLDRELKLDYSNLIDKSNYANTYIVTSELKKNIDFNISENIIYIPEVDNKLDLKYLFAHLGNIGINSIFIESGSELSSYLLDKDLIDEIVVYQTPKFLGKGISLFDNCLLDSPNKLKPYNLHKVKRYGDDVKLVYTKERY